MPPSPPAAPTPDAAKPREDPAVLVGELREMNEVLEKEVEFLRQKVEILDQQRHTFAIVTEKINMISRLSREINSLEFNQIVEICVEKIPLLVGARYASLFLYDYDKDEFLLERHNHPGDIESHIRLKVNRNTILGYVAKQQEMLVIQDLAAFEKVRGIRFERPFAEKYRTSSCIVAPLLAGNRVVGVLCLADKTEGGTFNDMHDAPVIQQLSDLVGAALRNVQLYDEVKHQAETDAMTGLANHETFLTELRREVDRSHRYKRPLALILIDVDHFKQFNDTYGHQVGDHILKETARIIGADVRQVDTAGRYGGDEFILLLPETDLPGAKVVADRIHQKIRTASYRNDGNALAVTVSIGVAGYRPEMKSTEFIKVCDEALYAAKQAGRDRVCIKE
ncbi:MAG: sensor domain-containing diguanylate cyclase [Planctomycetota bacterium]